jgi:hypothetical protein
MRVAPIFREFQRPLYSSQETAGTATYDVINISSSTSLLPHSL